MKKILLMCMLGTGAYTLNAQTAGVGINTTGAAANNNAMLDVSATNKGMLIPRVDLVALTSNIITSFGISATPTTSLLVYNTTVSTLPSTVFQTGFYYWDGSSWTKLNTGATSSAATGWSLAGNSGTTASNFIGTTDALPLSLRTTGLDRMTINAAGNVGIGTTAPAKKLHIVSSAEALRIEGASPWIGFAEPGVGNYNGYLYQTATNFILGTISGSTKNIQISPGGTTALTAVPSGRVGIGTAAPVASMDIRATSNLTTPQLNLYDNNPIGYSRLQFQNASGANYWQIGGYNTATNADERLNFYNSTSGNAMSITGDGRVGIGTTTPQDKFSIYTPPNNAGLVHYDNDVKIATWVIGAGSGEYGGHLGTMSNHALHFFTNNSAARVTLLPNGNFGIGTTNPAEKLSVNGTIRSKELKIEIINWPDYVFADNYKLQSLYDVEKFIHTNKHLPNIPSAEDIQTNGLKVGEVQTKMMQKIEELTLYIIELNKRIEKLEVEKKLVTQK